MAHSDSVQFDFDMEMFMGESGSPIKDKKSKAMYNNGYVRRITAEEAAKEMGTAGDYGPRCAQLQADLDQTWKDLAFEQENYNEWMKKEEEYRQTKAQLKKWNEENALGQISDLGTNCLNAIEGNPFDTDMLIQNARDKRLKSQKTKDEFLKRVETLRKEIMLIKSKQGSNVVYKDASGMHCMKYGSASNEAAELQSLKRDPRLVARDYCTMLASCDGLLKISYERSLPLVKEYQECFAVGSRDFELMNKVLYRLEKEKSIMSREQFAALCWETLSKENQREHVLAKRVIDADTESRYEFSLPADRERRMKKLESDKKLPGQIRRREEVKKIEEIRRYNNLVNPRGRGRGSFRFNQQRRSFSTPFYQNRGSFRGRGTQRGRGSRGNYRGRSFGQGGNNYSQGSNFQSTGYQGNNNYNRPPIHNNFNQNYNNIKTEPGYPNRQYNQNNNSQQNNNQIQTYAMRGGSRGRGTRGGFR